MEDRPTNVTLVQARIRIGCHRMVRPRRSWLVRHQKRVDNVKVQE